MDRRKEIKRGGGQQAEKSGAACGREIEKKEGHARVGVEREKQCFSCTNNRGEPEARGRTPGKRATLRGQERGVT